MFWRLAATRRISTRSTPCSRPSKGMRARRRGGEGGADWIRLPAVLTICALLATGLEIRTAALQAVAVTTSLRPGCRRAGRQRSAPVAGHRACRWPWRCWTAGTKLHGGLWFVLGRR